MRFGTRTNQKKCWGRVGRRPQLSLKIGYDWGWLYTALCPQTGEIYAMYISRLQKDCFALFLEEFRKSRLEVGKTDAILLIADGASAHQADCCPEGISLLKLPPYCPELNPVERFFGELRKVTANRIFETLQEVEACLTKAIQSWQNDLESVMKLTNFRWMKTS